jgi:hypothetical protein
MVLASKCIMFSSARALHSQVCARVHSRGRGLEITNEDEGV